MRIINSMIGSIGKKGREIAVLRWELAKSRERHAIKDAYFVEMISDGLRHGSSLAGKHMADRRWYLNGKHHE